MPTLIERIGQANPGVGANEAFINAVYRAQFNRDATRGELDRFRGKKVADVANLVLRDKSPFKGQTGGGRRVKTGPLDPRDQLLETLRGQIESLIESGKTINPNIEITPAKAAEFLSQASKELNPYFKRIANESIADLRSGFSELLTRQGEEEADLARQYREGTRGIGESAAERGLAFSGERQREERELSEEAQRAVDISRRRLSQGAQQQALAGERYLGSDRFGRVGQFKFGARPIFTPGSEQVGAGERGSLFTLSGGMEGELDRQRKLALAQRRSELEGAYRTNRSLNFY